MTFDERFSQIYPLEDKLEPLERICETEELAVYVDGASVRICDFTHKENITIPKRDCLLLRDALNELFPKEAPNGESKATDRP